MATAVKRAISLPREQDKELRKIAQKRHAPYSTLVQAAIQFFLQMEEREQLVQAYERYYANRKNAERTREAVRDMRNLSQRVNAIS